MKRLFTILAAAVALTGCASMPGGQEVTALAATAADVLTGPDTDYKNYLTSCRAEVKAQADALKAENEALAAGINSKDEKIQFGSLILLAAKSGMNGPRVGCSVERKRGFTELVFQNSNVLSLGVELYRENRAGARFNRQLEANKEMTKDRQRFELGLEDRRNRFITTLTGDELQLREQQNDFELDRQRLDQQAPAQ
jgi:hypothetical protein